jgi:hypothetical protein
VSNISLELKPPSSGACASLNTGYLLFWALIVTYRLNLELLMQGCATFVRKAATAFIVGWFGGRTCKNNRKWYT